MVNNPNIFSLTANVATMIEKTMTQAQLLNGFKSAVLDKTLVGHQAALVRLAADGQRQTAL